MEAHAELQQEDKEEIIKSFGLSNAEMEAIARGDQVLALKLARRAKKAKNKQKAKDARDAKKAKHAEAVAAEKRERGISRTQPLPPPPLNADLSTTIRGGAPDPDTLVTLPSGEMVRIGDLVDAHATKSRLKAVIPHMDARVREMHVVQLKGQRLTFAEIGRKVGLTEGGARQCYLRAIQRTGLATGAIQEHIEASIARTQHIQELALDLYDPDSIRASASVLDTALHAEERMAKLLGLDAPKTMRVTGDKGKEILAILASSDPLDIEHLEKIQEFSPVVKPEGAVDIGDNILSEFDPDVRVREEVEADASLDMNDNVMRIDAENRAAFNADNRRRATIKSINSN